jgi:hypothetical protein
VSASNPTTSVRDAPDAARAKPWEAFETPRGPPPRHPTGTQLTRFRNSQALPFTLHL